VRRLGELRDSFYAELGEELRMMAEKKDIDRWLNDAAAYMDEHDGKTATITWAADDYLVDLPTDFVSLDSIETDDPLPGYRVWHRKLRFDDSASSAGTATIFYLAEPTRVTGSTASTLPDILDQARVFYALARFFRRLTTSRSDYRRYSTIAQGNAAEIADLLALAERYQADFDAAVNAYEPSEAVTYFGGTL
jgi:hypothetical protein